MESDSQSDLFNVSGATGDQHQQPPDYLDLGADPNYLSSLDRELGSISEPAHHDEHEERPTILFGATPLEPGGEHNLSKHLQDETVHKLFRGLDNLPDNQTIEDLIGEIGVEEFLANHLRDFDAEGFPELDLPDEMEPQRSGLLDKMIKSMRELNIKDADLVSAAFDLSPDESASLKAAVLGAADEAHLSSFFEDGDAIADIDQSPASQRPPLDLDDLSLTDLQADKDGDYHLADDPAVPTDEFGIPVNTDEYRDLSQRFKAGRAALRAYHEIQQGNQIELSGLDEIPHAREALQILLDGAGTDQFGYPVGYSIPCASPEHLERAKKIAARRLEINPQGFQFELLDSDDKSPESLLARQYSIERQSADIFHISRAISTQPADTTDVDAPGDDGAAGQPGGAQVYDYDGPLYSFINEHSDQKTTGQSTITPALIPLFNELCLRTAGHAPADEQGNLLFACAINALWVTLAACAPGAEADYNEKTRAGLQNLGKALTAATAETSPYAAFKQGLSKLNLTQQHKQATARVDQVFKDLIATATAANKVRLDQVPAPARGGNPTITGLIAQSLQKLPSLAAARSAVRVPPIDLNKRRASIIANTVDEMHAVSEHVMRNLTTPSWTDRDSVVSATKLDKLSKSITPLIEGFRQSSGRPGDIRAKDGKPVDFSRLSEAVGATMGAMSSAAKGEEAKDLLESIQESIKLMNESIKRMLDAIKSILGATRAPSPSA